MSEIEKLLAEIEKKFSVDWGYNISGHHRSSHFITTGKGIVIPPGKWQAFRAKKLGKAKGNG
jgi:hypothetical protein